jgi:hypothetical protein
MPQKHRKTVPHSDRVPAPAQEAGSMREFLKMVPQLGFLLPLKKRNSRRLTTVKKMFSKILAALIPAIAEKDPDQINHLLHH